MGWEDSEDDEVVKPRSVLDPAPCWMCLNLYLALVELGVSDCSAMALAKIHHSELGEVVPMWTAEYLREVFINS